MDGKETLERMVKVIDACDGLPPADTLFVLEMAWLATASNLRNAQLANPGGFPSERDRQAETLEKLAAIVRSDTPDVELERLWLEGDNEGAVRHVLRLLREGGA